MNDIYLYSYAVITGLIEILSRRCMKIRESIENYQSVVLSLLATLGFITRFIDVCPPGKCVLFFKYRSLSLSVCLSVCFNVAFSQVFPFFPSFFFEDTKKFSLNLFSNKTSFFHKIQFKNFFLSIKTIIITGKYLNF